MGFELTVPVGYRRAATAVRNAELRLVRENAILEEQQLRVAHELSSGIRDVRRTHQLIKTNFNRRVASQYEVEAIQALFDAGRIGIDVLLQSRSVRRKPTAPISARSPTTIWPSLRFIKARARCSNTIGCDWPKVHGRRRRTTTPTVARGALESVIIPSPLRSQSAKARCRKPNSSRDRHRNWDRPKRRNRHLADRQIPIQPTRVSAESAESPKIQ